MNYARFCSVACLTLVHCRSSDGSPLQAQGAATPEIPAAAEAPVEDAAGGNRAPTGPTDPVPPAGSPSSPDGGVDASATPAAPAPPFPQDWCTRLDGLPGAIRIANAYNVAVTAECQTAGLTDDTSLTREQYGDWRLYLQDYSFLMAGCVPDYEPPEGGILVFGPANTPLVGAVRAPLSSNEAMLLVEDYVQAFASELALTPEERDSVRAYLLQVVASEIDLAATGSLSRCAALDAGQ